MATDTADTNAKYLYAIVTRAEGAAWLERGAGRAGGIQGGNVYCISNGSLSAVVSDVPVGKIRPDRRHLAAHHQILKHLTAECTVLPMSFGMVAGSPSDIQKILSANQALLTDQLGRLDAKIEMGLRVLWDVPNIFEYFISTHPELRALRDRFYRRGREPSREDKIELGHMFDRLLTQDRLAHTEAVEAVLGSQCTETRRNAPRDEREVMELACLVHREARKEFEEAVFEAAKLFDDSYRFDLNGPWPPHSFVDFQLQT